MEELKGKRTTVPDIAASAHPLRLLERAATDIPEILGYNFITYEREGEDYLQETDRQRFFVPARALPEKVPEIAKSAVADGLDLLISSEVVTTKGVLHLPMMDCAVPEHIPVVNLHKSEGLLKFFCAATPMTLDRFAFYDSGRSYHGYYVPHNVNELLDESHFRQFLYGLLVIPKFEGCESVFDYRWIGHRLRKGFAALRLTATDLHYVHEPRLAYYPAP